MIRFDAECARRISASAIKSNLTERDCVLLELVRSATAGLTCSITKMLTDNVIRELRQAGYTVTKDSRGAYKISW